jgi:hypothetical protein
MMSAGLDYSADNLLDDAFSVASTVVIGRAMSEVDAVKAFLVVLRNRRYQHIMQTRGGCTGNGNGNGNGARTISLGEDPERLYLQAQQCLVESHRRLLCEQEQQLRSPGFSAQLADLHGSLVQLAHTPPQHHPHHRQQYYHHPVLSQDQLVAMQNQYS